MQIAFFRDDYGLCIMSPYSAVCPVRFVMWGVWVGRGFLSGACTSKYQNILFKAVIQNKIDEKHLDKKPEEHMLPFCCFNYKTFCGCHPLRSKIFLRWDSYSQCFLILVFYQ